MNRLLNVACIQHACGDDREANLETSAAMLRSAAGAGAQLVLLQELHTGPYFCQVEDVACFDRAEPVPGPSCEYFGALARELGIVLVASLFERRAPGLYHNTAVVFERDGSIAGRYRKMHIPDDPAYYEKFYFTPGDIGFTPIRTSLGKLGVLVCWDQWYPEAARLMALAGADLLLYPTAIGWDPRDTTEEKTRQRDAWVTVQRAHAVANGIPVVVCNRIGFEPDPSGHNPGLEFWGHSFVAGPQGEMLATAGTGSAEVLHAAIDPGRSEQVRRIWPFLRDRRIDAYQDLVLRYRD
ncbi:MAG: carbon-nitrogen hydrolase [Gammaproteobacteria bacterium]|jgi:N-carbamoylputrescine amidase|nr:carbon-nitrogen hydrolase [Gammaproteobacteria bacterium]MBP6053546.1 carbon-nitrogen hydrolase [Pseudomonadales bacterium]MBK6584978.1 carbon-nitrogen hydrolase [Gammaproteobacteria bacterium]MBK7170802.1 carbon-nitrogen hydrolase [Gammaproteobacteria bacterium]MBK7519517.1 carbon-nitrogen hydrolase [Gammaproteobacteria bacterium]